MVGFLSAESNIGTSFLYRDPVLPLLPSLFSKPWKQILIYTLAYPMQFIYILHE